MRKTMLLIIMISVTLAASVSCASKKEKINFPVEKAREWGYTGDQQVGVGPGEITIPNIPFTMTVEQYRKSGSDIFCELTMRMNGQYFRGIILRINQDGDMLPIDEGNPLLYGELWKGRKWSTFVFGSKINVKVRGKEKIKTSGGEYDCWELSFAGGGTKGSVWLADGVGVVAMEYTSTDPDNTGRLSIKLKDFNKGGTDKE
ncbi:MAG: DUF3108 domain-containing protein [Chloroflexi bacterium]|nr:DUF3108 domain-containing protein [Chloroflexota bacterium]